jgi:hypothetical protein
MILVALLIGFDLSAAQPNPYAQPPLLAFGSGVAPSGGFCAALPN